MAAINEINKPKVVRSAKAYVARAKAEVLPPPPAKKTNQQIVDEIPYIRHPNCPGLAEQLLNYLNSPDLRGLLGTRNYNEVGGSPWTREGLIEFYAHHAKKTFEEIERVRKQREEQAARLAELKKNWNPTDADKIKFMMTYKGMRTKIPDTQATRVDSFCTCCGALGVHYPGMEHVTRMRWEVVTSDAPASPVHRPESLRIKDAESGKDMIISWDNA